MAAVLGKGRGGQELCAGWGGSVCDCGRGRREDGMVALRGGEEGQKDKGGGKEEREKERGMSRMTIISLVHLFNLDCVRI